MGGRRYRESFVLFSYFGRSSSSSITPSSSTESFGSLTYGSTHPGSRPRTSCCSVFSPPTPSLPISSTFEPHLSGGSPGHPTVGLPTSLPETPKDRHVFVTVGV